MMINGVKLTMGQLRYLLNRKFWKHTADVNLNTVPGCQEAASHAVDLLAEIGYYDYEPTDVPELETLYRESSPNEGYRPEAPGNRLDESLGALTQFIVGAIVSWELLNERKAVINEYNVPLSEYLARRLLEVYGKGSES